MELSLPERKRNKMLVPQNIEINGETISFLVIQALG